MKALEISGRTVGPGAPCFIIAEAGVNHNGSVERALEMVDVAAQAGASAIKFQTFDADRLVTRDAPKAAYQAETTGADESQHAMLRRLQLSRDDFARLARRCAEREIIFMSTPFEEASAQLLFELGVPVFKIPSGEITNLDLIRFVARFGRPMIVSTGMSTLDEVGAAVAAIHASGNEQLALLQCVSNYPAEPRDVNLRAMATMSSAFDVPAGFSDHTLGVSVSLAAVALGACIIEKHFTLDVTLPGPDHRASLSPDQLAELVAGIRTVEAALGDGRKVPAQREGSTADVARKSLVAQRSIREGVVITEADLSAMRPGTGLSPALRAEVIGRAARVTIPAGTLLTWEMLR